MPRYSNRIILVVLAIVSLGAATVASPQSSGSGKKQLEDCAKRGGTC
jgi:hypothetical protein